jgi:hypothetical protein
MYDVTGFDPDGLAVPRGDQTGAFEDVQNLSVRMVVPIAAGSWREANGDDGEPSAAGLVESLGANLAREVVGWCGFQAMASTELCCIA